MHRSKRDKEIQMFTKPFNLSNQLSESVCYYEKKEIFLLKLGNCGHSDCCMIFFGVIFSYSFI